MTESLVSIVIPIRAETENQREVARLEILLETIPDCFAIVIVDDGSHRRVYRYLESRVKSWGQERQLTLKRLNTRYRRFSLARARNAGVRVARSSVVMLHDVDFIGLPEVYERIYRYVQQQELATRPENFFCVPVAFLSESGTQTFWGAFQQAREPWCFRLRDVTPYGQLNFLVQGSSCMVLNRRDLLQMGGHDRRFRGHGAEDFELLHRLSSRFPIAPRPPEYERNMGSGNIQEYRGFRAYFALYGEEARRAGCTLVHLWHPKRTERKYYQHRRNFTLLQKILKRHSLRVGPRRWLARQPLPQGQRRQLKPSIMFDAPFEAANSDVSTFSPLSPRLDVERVWKYQTNWE
ncbi:glycosyltransferase [Salinicola corii]|uniref:glycosyltransferase n=1 Tax=Salinicola corii TaxID=2606937 RepID=UPI00165991A7|nr:glycosyltransferase [Salinicola corii]